MNLIALAILAVGMGYLGIEYKDVAAMLIAVIASIILLFKSI